jgi:hypothetical protein
MAIEGKVSELQASWTIFLGFVLSLALMAIADRGMEYIDSGPRDTLWPLECILFPLWYGAMAAGAFCLFGLVHFWLAGMHGTYETSSAVGEDARYIPQNRLQWFLRRTSIAAPIVLPIAVWVCVGYSVDALVDTCILRDNTNWTLIYAAAMAIASIFRRDTRLLYVVRPNETPGASC